MLHLIDNATTIVRRLAKVSLAYAAYSSGLLDRLAAFRTGIAGERRIVVLGFHRVVEDFNNSRRQAIPSLLISVGMLRRLFELIARHYDFISLDEALAALSGAGRLRRDGVVLTFDDGYRDFYDNALPLLRAYSLPATIFVPTALIGKRAPLAHDQLYYLLIEMVRRKLAITPLLERLQLIEALPKVRAALEKGDCFRAMRALFELPQQRMNLLLAAMKAELRLDDQAFPPEYARLDWPMVRELQAHGITIGAHTRNHVLLTIEPGEVAEQEVRGSKTDLERQLGQPVHHFAYPDGRYNDQIIKLVHTAGFSSACTIENRPNTILEGRYRLKRILLWERACLGLTSGFSRVVAACQLRGLFANPAFKRQRYLVESL